MSLQWIYCNSCGNKYQANFMQGWIHSGASARVCFKECYEKIDKTYVRGILNKPDIEQKDNNES